MSVVHGLRGNGSALQVQFKIVGITPNGGFFAVALERVFVDAVSADFFRVVGAAHLNFAFEVDEA